MLKINELNWTFCFFEHENCRAQIHQGGDFTDGKCIEVFYVNVLKEVSDSELPGNLKELDQTEFNSLQEATNHINKHFSHWKFINQLESKDTAGGCGSCVAH